MTIIGMPVVLTSGGCVVTIIGMPVVLPSDGCVISVVGTVVMIVTGTIVLSDVIADDVTVGFVSSKIIITVYIFKLVFAGYFYLLCQ